MCGVSSCLPSPAEKGGTPLSDLLAEVSLSLWIPLGIHTWVQFNLHLYTFKNKTTYLLMMWYSNSFVRDCLILIPSFLTSKGWDTFPLVCVSLLCYSERSLLLMAFFLCLIKEWCEQQAVCRYRVPGLWEGKSHDCMKSRYALFYIYWIWGGQNMFVMYFFFKKIMLIATFNLLALPFFRLKNF